MVDTLKFDSDAAAETYWAHEARAEQLPKPLDRIDAIKAFRAGDADLLLPSGNGDYLGYRLRGQYTGQQAEVRELTQRLRKRLLDSSIA